jgi:hypothetical protein
MLTNLINRIIELATGRVVDAVNFDEVQSAAVERIVEDGIDYNTLADELDMSTIAGEVDTYDLARELAEDRDLLDNVVERVRDSSALAEMVDEAVESANEGMESRMAALEARLDAMPEPGETPEAAPTEPTAVEVPASLTDRLLDMAVTRLLTVADEAVRDGKV